MKVPTLSTRTRCVFIAVAWVLLASINSGRADTINGTGWKGTANNGTANTGNWSAANWDSTPPSTGGTNERNLFFGQGYKAAGGTNFIANNDLASWAGYRITFQDSNAAGNGTDGSAANDTAFTITGNSFTLFDFGSGNFPRIQNDSFLTQTFSLTSGNTITLSGGSNNKAEINANNGNIVFSTGNKISLAGSTQLQINGGKSVTFGGIISGSNSVVISGGTTAIYGAVNTYTADTFVNNGTLQIASGGGVSSSSPIRLGNTATGSGNATLAFTSLTGGLTVGSIVNPGFAGGTGTYLIDSQNTSNTNTISGNIFLDASLRIQQATGGTLSITNATLDLKGNTLSLNTGATGNTAALGDINITGIIGNSTGSGQVVIGTNGFANSSGTVTLSSASTYSGETFLRNGTLAFTSAGSIANSTIRFGSTSGTGVDANINLTTAGGGTTISSTVNPVSTTGTGTLTINSQNTSGTNTFSGHFGEDRDLSINQTGGGTLAFTQARAGGANTITGFDIKTTTVTLGGAGNITFNDVYNSTGAGTGTIVSNSTGTVTLGGAFDNVALAATVNSGTLVLGKASTSAIHAIGSGLTIAGGTAQLGGSGGDQIFDGSNVTVTSGALDLNDRTETFTTLFLQGTGINNAGALLNSGTSTTGALTGTGITLTGNASLGATNSSARLQLNNIVITDGAGSFALTKVGAGELVLGNSGTPANGNTFDGGVNNNAGTLIVNSASNGSPGAITSGPLGTGTLTLNGGAIRAGSGFTSGSLMNAITLAADTTIASGGPANAFVLSGAMTISGATRTLTSNSTSDTNFSGAIGGAAGLGLTFNATTTGKFILSGSTANTYTGLTTVSAGELDLSKSSGNAIAGDMNTSTTDVTVSAGGTLKWLANNQVEDTATIANNGGTVDLNGKSDTIGTLTNVTGTFKTGIGGTLIGTTATIDFQGGTNVIAPDALVSDNHIKISGGTNVVQGLAGGTVGSVTYGAGTTSGGTLRLTSGGTGIEMTGATLVLNSDNSSAGVGKLLFMNSPGNLTSHASATTSVISSGGSGTFAGTVDLGTNTRTFTIEDGAAATDMSISARITNGSLIKAGAGTLALTGPNDYTGSTTIAANGGTLVAGVGTLVSTSSVTVNASGTLLLNGSGRHIGANAGVNLNGGTFNTGGFSEPGGTPNGTSASAIGALTLTATSTIDFGSSNTSILQFAAVGAHTVSTMLNMINWDGVFGTGGSGDRLLFNGLATTFTTAYNQGDVTFDGVTGYSVVQFFDGSNNPFFEVVGLAAVPEPSTWAAGTLVLVTLLIGQRRRIRGLLRAKP